MNAPAFLSHSRIFGIIWLHFFPWYFLEVPARMIKFFWQYLNAFNDIFSFWFLIKTLFYPWKSIEGTYDIRGLNIGLYAQYIATNFTSRAVGFTIRIAALLFGIILELVLLGIFILVLVLWLLFPILLVIDLLYLLVSLST